MAKRTVKEYLQKTAEAKVSLVGLLEAACDELMVAGASTALALALGGAHRQLQVLAARGQGAGAILSEGQDLDVAGSERARALLALRRVVAVDDATSAAGADFRDLFLERLGTRSLMVVPLLVEGEVRALLAAHAARPQAFGDAQRERAAALAGEVESGLARARPPLCTVLLVDDEAVVRQAFCRVLRGEGYRTLEARSAEEALAMLGRPGSEVKLVVSDVGMPGQGGVGLARKILAGKAAVGVILMSGFGNEELGDAMLLDPRLRFLQKPFNATVLANTAQELLGGVETRK